MNIAIEIRKEYLKNNMHDIYEWMIMNNTLGSHLEECAEQYRKNVQLYETILNNPFIARELAQAELNSNYLGEIGDFKDFIRKGVN